MLRRARRLFPFIEHIFADGGYAGRKIALTVWRTDAWRLLIVKRSDAAGFEFLPERWIVERTFAWIIETAVWCATAMPPGRSLLGKRIPGWRMASNMICGDGNDRGSPYERARAKLLAGWHNRALGLKAAVFGFVGLVNTSVDYAVFLLARAVLDRSPTALSAFNSLADFCHCGTVASISLVAANTMSWIVAATGSYVMNSSITFAHETGRKLRLRTYATFVVSGIAGWLANTAALLVAAEVLLLPVWLAKAAAILASFVVNFSLSHFIVFRVRGGTSN